MAYHNKFRPQRGGQSTRPAHKQGARPQKQKRGVYIHPSKFISRASGVVEETPYAATHTFADFNLRPALFANVSKKGYVTPSAIQDQSIPLTMAGHDVIGLANTGTGKTAAFLLPIIDALATQPKTLSVLILAPTRELAQQIDEQFRDFSYGMRLFSTLLVGGMNMDRQIRQLERQPHVIIGTPGRTMDHIKRGTLVLDHISTFVLDEADRMLDMGFIRDIRTVAEKIPTNRQTLFFSATMTPQIRELTAEFLRDPKTVTAIIRETSDNVDQDVVEASSKEEKLEKLLTMLQGDDFNKVLLFGETKFGVQRLSDHLEKSGISSVAIHGNKSQSQRQRALKAFKDSQARVLVATDVASRGLDIPNVSHVINFDQPATYEDYVHRIGRTGRGGAKGKALTFVSSYHRS